MNPEDFTYNSVSRENNQYDIFVISKDGVKFGASIMSRIGQPPAECIFKLFEANYRQFFIECESEIIKELEKKEEIIIPEVKKEIDIVPEIH